MRLPLDRVAALFAGLLVLAAVPGLGLAQSRTTQVYVVNPTGGISAQTAEAMAELMSANLIGAGVQAFTYRNLADQLQQEERKEILKCDEGSKCVDELVSSFGFARRLFGYVTKQGDDQWLVVFTLMDKSKVKNKVAETVSCGEKDLPGVAAEIALEVMEVEGRRGAVGALPKVESERPMEGAAPAAEYLVTFESDPPGAFLEFDGAAVGVTPFPMYAKAGSYRVRMSKPKYESREGVVVVKANSTETWQLTATIGWLDIESHPPALAVRVLRDDRLVQQVATPVKGLELDPGAYVIETADPGYLVQREAVAVEKGKKAVVGLFPMAKEGWLMVRAFDANNRAVAAEVWAADNKLGSVPGPWKMKVGNYEVIVRAEGYVGVKQLVAVEASRVAETSVTLNPTAVPEAPRAVAAPVGDTYSAVGAAHPWEGVWKGTWKCTGRCQCDTYIVFEPTEGQAHETTLWCPDNPGTIVLQNGLASNDNGTIKVRHSAARAVLGSASYNPDWRDLTQYQDRMDGKTGDTTKPLNDTFSARRIVPGRESGTLAGTTWIGQMYNKYFIKVHVDDDLSATVDIRQGSSTALMKGTMTEGSTGSYSFRGSVERYSGFNNYRPDNLDVKLDRSGFHLEGQAGDPVSNLTGTVWLVRVE